MRLSQPPSHREAGRCAGSDSVLGTEGTSLGLKGQAWPGSRETSRLGPGEGAPGNLGASASGAGLGAQAGPLSPLLLHHGSCLDREETSHSGPTRLRGSCPNLLRWARRGENPATGRTSPACAPGPPTTSPLPKRPQTLKFLPCLGNQGDSFWAGSQINIY